MLLYYSLAIFLIVNICKDVAGLPTLEEITSKCMKKSGATIEMLKSYKQRNRGPHQVNCFLKCKGELQGIFDENGLVIDEGQSKYVKQLKLTDKQAREGALCLKTIKPIKKCEDMIAFTNCYLTNEYDPTSV